MANNEQLSPTGPPALLYVEGEPPQVEFPDELTVRYNWSKPNPFFLPSLAAAAHLHLHARALPQAVPREVRRSRQARHDGRRCAGARLGATARPQGRHVQLRQPGPADAPALAPDDAAPGRALPVRAQRVPPGRSDRPAAALHRSGGVRRGRRQADPGQDRRRETDLQSRGLFFKHYTFLKESEPRSGWTRSYGRRRGAPISRSIPISTPTTRSGASCSGTCVSGARCRSPSTATRSTRSCTSASAWAAATPCCPRARCTSRSTATPGHSSIWSRPTRCSTRSA